MMFDTVLLDQTEWDLVLDSGGNIALASPPYALAQDVASAIRLFKGELYYDKSKGIPYFDYILGQLPPASVFTQYMNIAAKTVPGVVSVQSIIQSFNARQVTGQVPFTDESGVTTTVSF